MLSAVIALLCNMVVLAGHTSTVMSDFKMFWDELTIRFLSLCVVCLKKVGVCLFPIVMGMCDCLSVKRCVLEYLGFYFCCLAMWGREVILWLLVLSEGAEDCIWKYGLGVV